MCAAGTSAEEAGQRARAAAQPVLAAPKTLKESRKSVPGMALEQRRAQLGAGEVWRFGPRGAPRSVPRDGCRARGRRGRPYIDRPRAHIGVFRTRRPHAEGFGGLLVRLRHREPASVTEGVRGIGGKRAEEESVLGTDDEESCAAGRAGHAAREEKRRTGVGSERTSTSIAILRTLATRDALDHVFVAQTRGRTDEGGRETSENGRPCYGRQRELTLHEAGELLRLSDSSYQQAGAHTPSVDLTRAGAAVQTVVEERADAVEGKGKGACGAGASAVASKRALRPLFRFLDLFLSASFFPLFPASRLLTLESALPPIHFLLRILVCRHLRTQSPRAERSA
jgi:hypothetical protein